MLLPTKKRNTKKFLLLKTAAVSAIAASVIAFSHGPIAFATSSQVSTIYHVYVNGTYIGNINDKTLVDKVVAEQLGTLRKSLNDTHINLGPNIQYIPEQVLQAKTNNEETIHTIKNIFEVHAEASAIVIDGEPVVYVPNQETAELVIQKLKQKYVSEAQLKDLESREAKGDQNLPPLQDNQSRLLAVQLSKNISFETMNIEPEKILSANDAVTFLEKGTLEEKMYTVQEGDTLVSIAHQYGLLLPELLAINPGLNGKEALNLGQQLIVTAPKAYVDVNVQREASIKEKIPFENQIVEDSSLPKGQTKVKQKGHDGLRQAVYQITEQNGVVVKKIKSQEKILEQPVNRIVIKGTKVIPSRGDGSFAWPTYGGYVSSPMGFRWGKMHKGIDIARPSNKTIMAADNGRVIYAGWSNGYGNKIEIDHGNGYRTLYGHMSSLKVRVGQTVSKGSAIGVMGATGHATGVHLHFEIYKNGRLVNPLSYLR